MVSRRKPSGRVGRRPSTTRGQISDLAIELFTENGFDSTSVDDIAEAAGIARRTFFRYFPSKNAVPWGDFDEQLAALRTLMAELPTNISLAEGIRSALLQFNTFPEDEKPVHRQRMELILRNSALQGYSTLMYEGWRGVIAEYVAARTDSSPTDHFPRTVGWMVLGVAMSAYEQWLTDETLELAQLLSDGTRSLYLGLDGAYALPPKEST
ncbi:mycofactocin system transcriptional regulator [Rhodococcus sp. P1Y]|uniref:mycofactocin system transcriptional regulator n=1 Tax=Rhodococcus sp. P1Y TaxID=1302308 RepID=UPI000EACD5FA|nr:mycofactocin system transcriptional regulator [Rhodococcus sp. P1Y]AYJ49036.1 mycofactocin system transcriptional regulator [Rhodococcus sp. P1Y]